MKKNSEHTHTSHLTSSLKCCNITTTVNNASMVNNKQKKQTLWCWYDIAIIINIAIFKRQLFFFNMQLKLKLKKNSEHTHTSHFTSWRKCCNITTTVNNAASKKTKKKHNKIKRGVYDIATIINTATFQTINQQHTVQDW